MAGKTGELEGKLIKVVGKLVKPEGITSKVEGKGIWGSWLVVFLVVL
ncbi:hypothetical protein [Bacillus sp. MUM 116]|nr:hypothetical protein [Bacillus sp. MUM 116]